MYTPVSTKHVVLHYMSLAAIVWMEQTCSSGGTNSILRSLKGTPDSSVTADGGSDASVVFIWSSVVQPVTLIVVGAVMISVVVVVAGGR